MKPIFLIFFLVPTLLSAQDTLRALDCKLAHKTDVFTKQQTISTEFIPLEGASLSMDANKQEIDLLFTISGADKCFTDASTAMIFFAGSKQKQAQRNSGSMNCEGLFHFNFRNGVSAPILLRKLSTLKVEKILFVGNDKKETVVTLTPEQQQVVMDLAACMMKEAPSLAK
jgi:hypothetical protein